MQIRDMLVERAFQRDRLILMSGLVAMAGLSWIGTWYFAWDMQHSRVALCCMSQLLMFAMWAVMMVAMMLPSATPMVLLFGLVNRKRREQERPFVSTGIFLSGYLTVWGVFSALATVLEWRLHHFALLTPMMVSASPLLSGVVLFVAGLFQLTPLKHACLRHCRSPLSFLLNAWRDGAWGAFQMGLRHGTYCLGCCWLLMTLLFVAGVMNLLWLAAITIFVFLEKLAPKGMRISWVAGVVLMGWGLWMIGAAFR